MKYHKKTFDVPVGGDAFREGWERIWQKKPEEAVVVPDPDAVVLCMGCGGELTKDHFCHVCGAFR